MFFAGKTKGKDTKYVLDMFSYPSGDGLHTGHPRSYTATDIFARYYRMQGFDVLHPVGWDAFGLPAENYAIKKGIHPAETTETNVARFTEQLKSLGYSYDWGGEINTSKPDYYKWTQWLFKVLFDNGLAYQKEGYVNWCPKDQTVLANEQVVAGCCERCGTEIEQKKMNQWFFKVTEFADDLLAGLDKIDWPESTKESQRNWIGRSEGAEIDFKISDRDVSVTVFTTRPDTIYGATCLVLAPEHEAVEQIVSSDQMKEVQEYQKQAMAKTQLDRTMAKEKTGVFTGAYAINPANNEKVPVWIADYVLGGYGFGAVMAVPAHDERDFEFANKFGLEIIQVIEADELPFTGKGKLINSGSWNGETSGDVELMISREKVDWARSKIQYRLHDWSVARQRYWGAPIPIIYDEQGVPHSVEEKDLPVLLPMDVDFTPTGEPPLAKSEEFNKGVKDGYTRSVETLDTFVCSSWYFLRYCDPHNSKEFASEKQLKKWMPVDLYVGGAEHTNGHLLYSRFITKALHKLGYLDFDEPFLKLRHQGLILAADGEKMSKSRGNVVNPDELIEQYGADALRMYEMFMGPFDQSVAWDTNGISGVKKFLDRFYVKANAMAGNKGEVNEQRINALVMKVTNDIEGMKFNTMVSSMMEYLNGLEDSEGNQTIEVMAKLISPVAPHIAEEVWQEVLGNKGSIFDQDWPSFDAEKAKQDVVIIAVQEKGKLRGTVEVPVDSSEEVVLEMIAKNEKLSMLAKDANRHIFVANKIINFI